MSQISLIIPVFNGEKYIRQCLDSIICQTFRSFEVILIDDGSTDSSGSICDEYASRDSRFKVIHQKNAGVSAARNTGLRAAKAQYIAFTDSDDYVEKNYLEVLYNNKIQMQEPSLACISHRRVNGDIEQDTNLTKQLTITTPQDALRIMICKGAFGYVWNSLYDRDIIIKNHLEFNVEHKMWEDRCFNLKYFKHIKKVCVSPDVLYNYRILKTSASHKPQNVELFCKSMVACHEEIIPFLNNKDIAQAEYNEIVMNLRAYTYHVHSHECTSVYTKEFRNFVYNTYVKYKQEFPGVRIVHNRSSKLLDLIHKMVWATNCKPIIKSFLFLGKKYE